MYNESRKQFVLKRGCSPNEKTNCGGSHTSGLFYRKGVYQMSKHLNPLEKEFLIRQFKNNPTIKLTEFCSMHGISDTAFRKWIKQYEEAGIEGLARADAEIKDILPESIDRTEEAYKKEILRLRIENERLKKNYTVWTNEAGEQEYVRLKPKNLK